VIPIILTSIDRFGSPLSVYGQNREQVLGGDDLQRWTDIIYPEDRDGVLASLERVRQGGRVTHEFRIVRPSDQRIRWIREATFPLLDEMGRISRIGGIGRDVTDQKAAEAQNELLIKEINHRSKNLLSVVQAIVHQTARGSDSQTFALELSARLAGLAASQDLLLKTREGVDIGELVRSQLAHLERLIGFRITIEGPFIRLTTGASQTIGMAMHELATNASKYGALSNTLGTINVKWSLSGSGADRCLEMVWEERGGPVVSPPTHQGFGTDVLTKIIQVTLDAHVDLTYARVGLRWLMRAPTDNAVTPLQVEQGR